jgi:hypothetical protein
MAEMDNLTDFRTRNLSSNETRLPAPEPGEAIVVSKYGEERKAVILHPDDFDLFQRYRRILGRTPFELQLTETAITAHRLAGAEPVEGLDLASLERAML